MPDLLHQISIAAPPETVYASLATQAGLRGWWTRDAVAEEQIGSRAEFGFDHRSVVFRMSVEELVRGKRVGWSCHGDHPEWKGTRLVWEITPDGEGSVLRFRHQHWKEASDFFAMCNSTWGELIYRLRDHAEGKAPGPHWTE